MWCRMVKAVLGSADHATFAGTKIATARFFMARLLPESTALFQSLMSGARPLMEMEAEAF